MRYSIEELEKAIAEGRVSGCIACFGAGRQEPGVYFLDGQTEQVRRAAKENRVSLREMQIVILKGSGLSYAAIDSFLKTLED